MNDREDCAHLYNSHESELKECSTSHIYYHVANGYCNDASNTEECNWDGGDCCGDEVVMTECSVCECLEPSRWNDNTCEEFRRFICEKEGAG